MTKLLLFLALALALHAEDAKPPTVEELTAQLAVKDQEIAALKRQATEMQRDVSLYRQNFNACVDQIQAGQQPALNPTQQRMIRQRPTPETPKAK